MALRARTASDGPAHRDRDDPVQESRTPARDAADARSSPSRRRSSPSRHAAAHADAQSAFADFKAGRYLEAAAEIQAVVDRSPGYAYGYFLLGHCMLKMKRTPNAEYQFGRALSLDATRPEFFEGMALALNASGNWPFAVRACSDGLTLQPDARTRFGLLTLRAYAWGGLRRWDDAVKDLEAAQRIHSEAWLLVLLVKHASPPGGTPTR